MATSLKVKITLIWNYDIKYLAQIGEYGATVTVDDMSYSLWFKSSQAKAMMAMKVRSKDMLYIEGELLGAIGQQRGTVLQLSLVVEAEAIQILDRETIALSGNEEERYSAFFHCIYGGCRGCYYCI
ncbi:hypothetical protein NQZ79_g8338 [Umbelopsis isabellina]|nr:hypothetical protein NQZ79_g8338 [Umbelopsis isabellina]